MKKILEKELSYYRLDLHTGNVIYFGHSIPVKEEEYIDLDIKNVVKKIDEVIDGYNALSNTITELSKENADLKAQNKALSERVEGVEKKAVVKEPLETKEDTTNNENTTEKEDDSTQK